MPPTSAETSLISEPPEIPDKCSPIDPALVDTNAGEVPADRPHLRSWPKRLPRTVVPPETSLWANVEVAVRRYPDKAATLFFGIIPQPLFNLVTHAGRSLGLF